MSGNGSRPASSWNAGVTRIYRGGVFETGRDIVEFPQHGSSVTSDTFLALAASWATRTAADHTTFAQLRSLRQEVVNLQKEIEKIKDSLEISENQVREISNTRAKNEIKEFFEGRHGEVLYPDEIAEALNLEIEQVIRLCRELEVEDKIGEVKAK